MLTTSQLTALKTAILADPTMSLAASENRWWDVAEVLNTKATPDFIVWLTAITKEDIYANGFTWTEVDSVTDLKWRVWNEIFWSGAMNPSKPNVRAAIAEVWRGTAGKLAVQAYVLGKCKRPALLGEKLLATGTGTLAEPATMTYEGVLGAQDCADAVAQG